MNQILADFYTEKLDFRLRLKDGKYLFCLVGSSSNPKRLVFPKGAMKRGETLEITALRETWEEAGVRGRIISEIDLQNVTIDHGLMIFLQSNIVSL